MFNKDKIKVKPNGEISIPDEVAFTLKCNECGNEHVRFIDKHVYDTSITKPDYISIELYCPDCKNSFEFVVHSFNV